MFTPANRKLTYALALTLLATLGVGVNSIVYTNHATRAAERRAEANAAADLRNICGFVIVIDDAYTQAPPPATQPAAVRFAAEIHHLRQALHCDQHRLDGTITPSAPAPSAS